MSDHYKIAVLGDQDSVLGFKALGLDVVEVDLCQILKAGGGPHCMTFPLKRDGWKAGR